MKTVIDAVNDLKAFLKPACIGNIDKIYLFKDIDENKYWLSSVRLISPVYGGPFDYICTVGEFNACVDELSAATWINGISIEEWKAGMKNTVTDSHGNELELGKVYVFRDDCGDFEIGLLGGIDNDHGDYRYRSSISSNGNTKTEWWKHLSEIDAEIGTIKKAPAKLIDGKAYQFESNGSICIGIFDGDNLQDNNRIYMVRGCTNIIPLVPETKQ